MVAPRSSTTESPRIVGHTAAIAGRSMPGSMRRQNRPIAISAPLLPADIATSASPFLTASMASHIDEVLRPRRSAWLGLSCMLTATSVWMTRDTADIATHGVKRDSNLLRHERPGNLISCGLEVLGRGLGNRHG